MENYKPKTREKLEKEIKEIFHRMYKGYSGTGCFYQWQFGRPDDHNKLEELFYNVLKRVER